MKNNLVRLSVLGFLGMCVFSPDVEGMTVDGKNLRELEGMISQIKDESDYTNFIAEVKKHRNEAGATSIAAKAAARKKRGFKDGEKIPAPSFDESVLDVLSGDAVSLEVLAKLIRSNNGNDTFCKKFGEKVCLKKEGSAEEYSVPTTGIEDAKYEVFRKKDNKRLFGFEYKKGSMNVELENDEGKRNVSEDAIKSIFE